MMAKLDENKTCSLHYAADMCRALIDGLADQVDQCRGIVTGADLAENSVSVPYPIPKVSIPLILISRSQQDGQSA